ncbi:MarR family transcriptional regulator [Amycolatopsis rhabdoformis]|uniref:MarR family transcriptional regulator n=1 Tax=Amycolatopsis rhabdoformis TaxID=1448059 RepID=A0ABZ1II20_9PSEU|nr:MarR family transcriptional regulator [Amycolatopsis rhabdoformis]WSE34032.1 MarR family transcriptional regulator [Amycolatopsis rhabdoformis]
MDTGTTAAVAFSRADTDTAHSAKAGPENSVAAGSRRGADGVASARAAADAPTAANASAAGAADAGAAALAIAGADRTASAGAAGRADGRGAAGVTGADAGLRAVGGPTGRSDADSAGPVNAGPDNAANAGAARRGDAAESAADVAEARGAPADMTDAAQPAMPVAAGFWLHQAALAWRAALDVRLRPLGLTPTQFLLLSAAARLERTAGPATQQEVAEHAGADRMMTSKVLRALEVRGLVTRAAHERDARAVRVALTPDGRDLTAAATAIATEFDTAFFGPAAEHLARDLRSVAEVRGRPIPSAAPKTQRTPPNA